MDSIGQKLQKTRKLKNLKILQEEFLLKNNENRKQNLPNYLV